MAILTPALVRLRSDFNLIAPGRDTESDGWIGDYRHQAGTSSHNPDDTVGSRSEYSDSDNIPEVRAIDVDRDLRTAGITMQQCINRILATPADLRRLNYMIFNRVIWSASTGWEPHEYTGSNPHDHHGHFNGNPARDDDAAPWSILQLSNGGAMFVRYKESGPYVQRLQMRLNNLTKLTGASAGSPDGDYGDATKAAVTKFNAYCGVKSDGLSWGPADETRLDAVWAKFWTGGQVDAAKRQLDERIAELNKRISELPAGGNGLTFPMTLTINEVK